MSERKTLLVDGQVFQTGARDRGMGRYAICVIQAFQKQADYNVEVILSRHLPLEADDRKVLSGLFDGAPMHDLDLWATNEHAIEDAFAHNTEVLDAFVASKSGLIDYFVPSLFQEPTVVVFPTNVRAKTVLFHDLIPYLYHERYEPVMYYDNYLKRFKYMFEADIIFANSQTVADDIAIYTGVPQHKLIRIDGAAIHTDASVSKPSHIDLSKKPFILFNTSDDPRKNNLTTVLGFEEFCRNTHSDYSLVLTSNINERERAHLEQYSDRLVFTGNVPERELNWLYENCELVLCTPESEGLGLMVLEAVDAGKKVVCSSISVFQEISTDAFFYCNHESSYSIAQALARAIDPKAKISTGAYQKIKDYYSWQRSAQRMIDGLEHYTAPVQQPKFRLAMFTATPSGLSGVGLTASVLHPVMAEYFDIDYYIEQGLSNASIRPNYLQYIAPCYPAQQFSAERYADYDAVVYHMGNGDYHLESIKNALYLPGYVIVHDTNLREAYRVLREQNMMSAERTSIEERLDELGDISMSNYYSSIANRSLGLLTHSDYATKAMQEVLDVQAPIQQASLPTNVPEHMPIRGNTTLTIGLAGAISDVKGLDVITAIAEDPSFKDCNIRLFGFNHASKDKLAELEAFDNVSIATNVSDFDFQTSFTKLDVFVNYRMIYKGETSNTTLEAMRQGVVTIVRNIGWFSELDDDVVVKVDNPEAVLPTLRKLVADKQRLQTIGKQAKAYVAKHFTQKQYAESLQKLLMKDQSQNPNAPIAKKLHEGRIKTAAQLNAAHIQEKKQ